MHYQLPNGKSIEMSLEKFLSMSDEELQQLDHSGSGSHIEDPWFGSAIHYDSRIDHPILLADEFIQEIDDTDLSGDLIDYKFKIEKSTGLTEED